VPKTDAEAWSIFTFSACHAAWLPLQTKSLGNKPDDREGLKTFVLQKKTDQASSVLQTKPVPEQTSLTLGSENI
jgi:hypothetical protein